MLKNNKKQIFGRKEPTHPPQVKDSERKKPFATRPSQQEKSLCKNAWLSGMPNGELVKIGNCSPRTLDNWKAEWKDLRTDALFMLRSSQLEINVTEVELQEHRDYIETLRSLKTKHESELNLLDDISNALNLALENLESHPDFDSTDFKQVCAMLKSFASAKDSRSKLQQDYKMLRHSERRNRNYNIPQSGG